MASWRSSESNTHSNYINTSIHTYIHTKSVCLRRTCVSMLQRLIRGFLKIVASRRTSVEDQIRFSLQRDVPGHPYVFEVNFFDGGLSRSVFIGMDGIGEEEHIRIPYALGTP